MSDLTVNVNGKKYPCRATMGAMLRFKEKTGKEVTEIDSNSFTDLCTYLWCCISSASAHDKAKFNMSLMDFADSISPRDMAAWSKSLQEDNKGGGQQDQQEKKR